MSKIPPDGHTVEGGREGKDPSKKNRSKERKTEELQNEANETGLQDLKKSRQKQNLRAPTEKEGGGGALGPSKKKKKNLKENTGEKRKIKKIRRPRLGGQLKRGVRRFKSERKNVLTLEKKVESGGGGGGGGGGSQPEEEEASDGAPQSKKKKKKKGKQDFEIGREKTGAGAVAEKSALGGNPPGIPIPIPQDPWAPPIPSGPALYTKSTCRSSLMGGGGLSE